MSSNRCRLILPVLMVLVAVGVAAAGADSSPAVQLHETAVTSVPPQADCAAPPSDLFAASVPPTQCMGSQTAAPLEPGFMVQFVGHCACSCKTATDCNTSADCGGLPCWYHFTCC
jgi:hypothetical protein